jgi:hypothetical protein
MMTRGQERHTPIEGGRRVCRSLRGSVSVSSTYTRSVAFAIAFAPFAIIRLLAGGARHCRRSSDFSPHTHSFESNPLFRERRPARMSGYARLSLLLAGVFAAGAQAVIRGVNLGGTFASRPLHIPVSWVVYTDARVYDRLAGRRAMVRSSTQAKRARNAPAPNTWPLTNFQDDAFALQLYRRRG